MSRQTKDLYDYIEFIPDEDTVDTDKSKDLDAKNEKSDSSSSSSNVIIDREDSNGFDVDWETIDKNYKEAHHRHHHSHHHSHHSSGSSSGKNKISGHAHGVNSKSKKNNKYKDNNNNTSGKKKKHKKLKRIILGFFIFLLCIIISLVATVLILNYQGKQALLDYDKLNVEVPNGADANDGGRIVYYNGHTYEFNKKIATVLFMGIDNTYLNDDKENATVGQADALYLFTFDTSTGKIRVLCLNRDTITSISRYDVGGTYRDTTDTQLCLAYAYGDGFDLSAENQVTAVERLLYNVPINAYYAIDLSAIAILNDDIGGVTLTPQYTFGSFTKGVETTILGDRAEEFVRHRDFTLLDDNLRRMECQKQYINSFASQAVSAIKKDFTLPITLYEDTMEYTVTNISTSELTYLATTLATDYSGLELITTKGEYKMIEGDSHAQFHVDKEDLFEKVLDIFYIQVD